MPSRILKGSSLLLLSSVVASGASVTYFDRTAFTNACLALSGVRQNISFDAYAPEEGMYTEFGPSFTLLTSSATTFTTRGYLIASRAPSVTDSSAVLHSFDSSSSLRIQFGSGALAFGADLSSYISPAFASFTATVSLDTGETFSFTSPANPHYTFFGFTSDIPVTDLTFSDGGTAFGYHEELIRDIHMVTVIPEPGSLALLGLGTAVFGYRAARRQKWASRPAARDRLL